MKKVLLAAAFAVSAIAGAAHASTLYSPTSIVRNDFGEYSSGYPQDRMINGAGVNAPFVSGSTNFASFVASNPTHDCNNCGDQYFGQSNVLSGIIDFDLGQSLSVLEIGLFNNQYRGLLDFDIFISDDATFSSSTLVGSFALSVSGLANANPALEVLDVSDTVGRYLRFDIASYRTNILGFGEVFVNATPAAVPVPASLPILASGLVFLGALRRRKAKN